MLHVIWNIRVQVRSNLYSHIKNHKNKKPDFHSEKISPAVPHSHYRFVSIVLCCFISDTTDFFFSMRIKQVISLNRRRV